jgi:hypothetical protein
LSQSLNWNMTASVITTRKMGRDVGALDASGILKRKQFST